jgi:hypothetical protein
MLVLSDEVDTVRRRDNEVEGVREEVRRGREEVAREVVKLLGGRVEPEQRSQAGDGDGEGETEEIIASRGQS